MMDVCDKYTYMYSHTRKCTCKSVTLSSVHCTSHVYMFQRSHVINDFILWFKLTSEIHMYIIIVQNCDFNGKLQYKYFNWVDLL